jgi:hypothetical protein
MLTQTSIAIQDSGSDFLGRRSAKITKTAHELAIDVIFPIPE